MDAIENVYVLGFSPLNDTVWGVYATKEAAMLASMELGLREYGIAQRAGWIEKVPLRRDGSLPREPFIS
jgi:hypothetical protein